MFIFLFCLSCPVYTISVTPESGGSSSTGSSTASGSGSGSGSSGRSDGDIEITDAQIARALVRTPWSPKKSTGKVEEEKYQKHKTDFRRFSASLTSTVAIIDRNSARKEGTKILKNRQKTGDDSVTSSESSPWAVSDDSIGDVGNIGGSGPGGLGKSGKSGKSSKSGGKADGSGGRQDGKEDNEEKKEKQKESRFDRALRRATAKTSALLDERLSKDVKQYLDALFLKFFYA